MGSCCYKAVVVQLAFAVHGSRGRLWASAGMVFVVLLFVLDWIKWTWLWRCPDRVLAVQAGGTQQLAFVAPVGRHGSFNAHVAAMASEQRHRLRATQAF